MATPPDGIGPGNRIAELGGFTLYASYIRRGDEQQALTGIVATVENTGQITHGTSAARVIGGAILAGPVGALVGAASRKRRDERELYLHVAGPDYYWVEQLNAKLGAEARQFAASITRAASWEW